MNGKPNISVGHIKIQIYIFEFGLKSGEEMQFEN